MKVVWMEYRAGMILYPPFYYRFICESREMAIECGMSGINEDEINMIAYEKPFEIGYPLEVYNSTMFDFYKIENFGIF